MNFSIGEIAVYHKPVSANHGALVEVTGPLENRIVNCTWTGEIKEGLGHNMSFLLPSIKGPHALNAPQFALLSHLRKLKDPDPEPVEDRQEMEV